MKALFTLATLVVLTIGPATGQELQPNRVIVLTDIEADPDDTQSLIRLLLYTNEVDVKALVATTSCWQKTAIYPASISRVIKAYSLVQSNLRLHDARYPDAEHLQSLVVSGSPVYGMAGVGDGKDTEGSVRIIQELERPDSRPLWISVWGGANTLAQALYTLKKTRPEKEWNAMVAKLRVYTISDQDDSGLWIRNTFPNLYYIVSPGDHYASATWTGINTAVKGIDNTTISNEWLHQNIQQGHGPLGALYPDVAWGMEGDTPAFLSLIPNGLNEPLHPDWGGWGGRYESYKPAFHPERKGTSGVPIAAETRPIWTDAQDLYTPHKVAAYGRAVVPDSVRFHDNKVTLWRWRDEFQNDFAARMDWCTKPLQQANHPPVVVVDGPLQRAVRSGEDFFLEAMGTNDPDGDSFSFLWMPYPEAGSGGTMEIDGADNIHKLHVRAPEVEKESAFHIILKVTDHGQPALSRYRRIIVTVKP